MDVSALKRDLEGPMKIEDNPAIVKQKSRDFFWYSPVLKRQLDHVTGDLVVSPKSEAEVIHVLKTCFAEGVPVTPRGSGTGNYGQAMPLSGGVVLSLAEMNKVKAISRGRVVAEAGAVLAEIDKQTRAGSQQEIRLHPSTYNTASIGGFIAGGSGGIGSINWGGLRDIGNVLAPPRRHHGGGAARPRTEGPRPRQGDARLRHQRHHHRSRDPARRRLRLGRRHGRLRRLHAGGEFRQPRRQSRTGFSSRRSRPSRHRCPTTISCATRNS